jgi:hypothetical protein
MYGIYPTLISLLSELSLLIIKPKTIEIRITLITLTSTMAKLQTLQWEGDVLLQRAVHL